MSVRVVASRVVASPMLDDAQPGDTAPEGNQLTPGVTGGHKARSAAATVMAGLVPVTHAGRDKLDSLGEHG